MCPHVRVERQGVLLSPPHPTPPHPNPPTRRFDTTEHPASAMCPHVRVRRQGLLLSPPHPTPPQPTKQLWVGVLMCVRRWSWSVCADDPDVCAAMIRGCVRRWPWFVCADDPSTRKKCRFLDVFGKKSAVFDYILVIFSWSEVCFENILKTIFMCWCKLSLRNDHIIFNGFSEQTRKSVLCWEDRLCWMTQSV